MLPIARGQRGQGERRGGKGKAGPVWLRDTHLGHWGRKVEGREGGGRREEG